MNIKTRVDRLEAEAAKENSKKKRYFSIRQLDGVPDREAEIERLIREEGYRPGEDDLLIVNRVIVDPPKWD